MDNWVVIKSQRIKHLSLYCLSNIITNKEMIKTRFKIFSWWLILARVCRRPVFQDLDLAPFQFNVGLDPGGIYIPEDPE